jgi:ATP-binding cassette subfamily C (CFTR/MRP) protein 1
MEKVCGDKVGVYGTMAYVPQQAWVQNHTVRNNITFGQSFDQHFYDIVVQGCALAPDFEILSYGDMTEIGEKVYDIFLNFFNIFSIL